MLEFNDPTITVSSLNGGKSFYLLFNVFILIIYFLKGAIFIRGEIGLEKNLFWSNQEPTSKTRF